MNQKGILLESLLLVLVVIIASTVISNSRLASQSNSASTVRDYYDLTAKWQNARFLLEQETSNWLIEQIRGDPNCEYIPKSPDLNQALNDFNNAESSIKCSASFGELQSDNNFTVRLSCWQQNPNGESTVFAKDFNIAKHIESNGTSPNCNIRIRDLQSETTDFEMGSLRGCKIVPDSNTIDEGIQNWFKIEYQVFSGGSAPTINNVDCGNGGSYYVVDPCGPVQNGNCHGYCDSLY